MDILNVQSLITQGLVTDIANIDPNKAYIVAGVYQPGNRQLGAGGNAYPSYAIPVSDFLSSVGGVTGSGSINYIAKWSPTGIALSNSVMYDDGINVGVNNPLPTAQLHIKGVDITSSNFGLKVDDASFNPVLYTRNDRRVSIGTTTIDAALRVQRNDFTIPTLIVGNATGTDNWHFVNAVRGSYGWLDMLEGNMTTPSNYRILHVISNNGVSETYYNGSANIRMKFSTEAVNNRIETYDNSSNPLFSIDSVSGQSLFETANVGIGLSGFSATAKLHIEGIDSTSSNYALKVDNSASSPLLYVRNDGYITNSSVSDTASFFISNKISGDSTLKVQSDSAGRGFVVTENSNINTGNAIQLVVSNAGVRSIRGLSNSAGAVISNLNIQATSLGVGSSVFTPTYQLDVESASTNVFRAHGNTVTNNSVFSSSNQSVSLTLDTAVSSQLGSVGGSLILNTLGSTKASLVTNSSTSNVTLKSDNGYWLKLVNSTTESIGLGQGGNYIQFATNSVTNMLIEGATGNVAIGTALAPAARLHVQGVNSTSENFALKVDNSASSPLLYVRNDGQVEMNGFTIRQLASATYFKTSGTNGYVFNNASDSTNLGKISNTGQILFGDITDTNYVGIGVAVKATLLTSNATKEYNAAFFKNNTDQDGVYFSSKQGVAYVQTYSLNSVNQSLVLGGRNSGTGVLETLILKSTGVVNTPTMPTSSVGLVAGDLWNNAGVVNIV